MVSMRSEGTIKDLPEDILVPPISGVQQEDLTFLDFLLIITRRKKLVGLVTAICAGIALILAFALPQEYTATVIILPPQGNSSMSSMLASQLSGMNGAVSGMASSMLGMKNINDMYVSMLKSQSVEDAVVRRYSLQSEFRKKYLVDARKALENHTKIDGSTKDGLIRLSFTDKDPNRSAEIANGYVEQFKSLSQHLAITEASQRRVVFENQLEKTKIDLENADEALKKTQLQTGMVQVDGQARAMIDSAARLRAQIVAKEVQIQAMRSYAGDENPALTQAQTELDGLRAQFNRLVGSKGGSSDDVFLPKGAVPEAGLEYVRRLRDVKYYEAIFEILAKQLELAKLDEAREGAFIQVVDPAVTPEKKSFPKRGLLIAGGLAMGFTLGLMLALLQGGLVRMRQNPATKDKLDLLKMSLWSGSTGRTRAKVRPQKVGEVQEGEVHPLRHVRPEATGSRF
ncbi:GumC family protein [Occallatibacter savannae]|uniref:GumC family protein n=1 Tax=Occallatibacter savannae TaxID=1002691 RepID=UPI001EF6610D|nr:Wzz/FepE/Etk N-terminal domain-containing protein [Occallatibacter savannae]